LAASRRRARDLDDARDPDAPSVELADLRNDRHDLVLLVALSLPRLSVVGCARRARAPAVAVGHDAGGVRLAVEGGARPRGPRAVARAHARGMRAGLPPASPGEARIAGRSLARSGAAGARAVPRGPARALALAGWPPLGVGEHPRVLRAGVPAGRDLRSLRSTRSE